MASSLCLHSKIHWACHAFIKLTIKKTYSQTHFLYLFSSFVRFNIKNSICLASTLHYIHESFWWWLVRFIQWPCRFFEAPKYNLFEPIPTQKTVKFFNKIINWYTLWYNTYILCRCFIRLNDEYNCVAKNINYVLEMLDRFNVSQNLIILSWNSYRKIALEIIFDQFSAMLLSFILQNDENDRKII